MRLDFRCGNEDILHFGLVCDANDPCQVYLELSAVETMGNRVFLSGNFHTSSTTLASLLLVSEDAGKSWRNRTSVSEARFWIRCSSWISNMVG